LKLLAPLFFTYLLLNGLMLPAQFHPPAGLEGSNAIHKDSAVFVGWATGCEVVRGYMNIAEPELGYASAGTPELAIGKAGQVGTVSLGDAGYAILTFEYPIINGEGYDFAVFENAFSDDFLELAYVEVSSDGVNYFRFPSVSLTQTEEQIGTFGSVDATKINNLAGKYRVMYGTPFDLEELKDQPGLDVNHVTHVKIIDAVGSIDDEYARFDSEGNKINFPWPTPFETGGFDLDAIGVLHHDGPGLGVNHIALEHISVYPNPATEDVVNIQLEEGLTLEKIVVVDMYGREVFCLNQPQNGSNIIPVSQWAKGVYFVLFQSKEGVVSKKLVVN
jgi:hypothetical protein